MKTELIEKAYAIARERYAEIGVDTEKALAALQNISLSLHCWQADDVTGFENRGGDLTGGIQATGNYPGKARNIGELRADILKAKSFIPGTHRLNLHEIYGEFGGETVDRDQVEPRHFQGWIEWAKEHGIEARLQLDVVLAPQERRSLAGQPRPRNPGLLGGTHQALPRHCRRDGQGAGRPLDHEPLGARRLERPYGEPHALPRAAA